MLSSTVAIAGIVLAGLLPTAAVHAEDGKVYNGNSCHPFGNTPSQLYRYVFGVKNFFDSVIFVECPGIRDEVYTNTGLNSAVVTVEKAANTTVTCYLSSFSRDYKSSYSMTRTDSSATAGKKTLTFSGLGGYSAGYYGLQCSLPAGATLFSYQLNEYEP